MPFVEAVFPGPQANSPCRYSTQLLLISLPWLYMHGFAPFSTVILLQVVDVLHVGAKPVSKKDLNSAIAKLHKVDVKTVVTYGFSTVFGGGRSSGFGLIYDAPEDVAKFEPKYRLTRLGQGTKKVRSRKQWKDLKKKKRETWGTGRRAAARATKKAAAA
jgi:small subunit ribosomal protein S24e